MTLLFVAPTMDPADWIAALAQELPEIPVRVWPDMGDPGDIRYAITWKPPHGLLASLPHLGAVLSLGAGVDSLLSDPTLPAAVPVIRLVDPALTACMTEYVVWQVLAWHRHASAYRAHQQDRRWQKMPERIASERTVGIMGLGELGLAAARALVALGFHVTGWSRSPRVIDGVGCYAGAEGMDAFLASAQCLVCLLPLTDETEGILNADLFARLPGGAHVINAGRGRHLVDQDLLHALSTGQISGAALDVFETEPLPTDHPFWDHPQVTVTPHVAAVTHPRSATVSIAAAIRELEQGRLPRQTVDRGRGY